VRALKQPLRVGGHDLPVGTRVAPSIWLTNRDSRTYEQPREFRPERFLDRQPETFAWIPFGGGIRRCIGASFALLEMRLMLRTILEELQPSLPHELRRRRLPIPAWRQSFEQGERIRRRAITLVPGAGTRVVWRKRG
jgi:cytochrome P450